MMTTNQIDPDKSSESSFKRDSINDISVTDLRLDLGTQLREKIDKKVVREYTELLIDLPGEWPFKEPVTVFFDGEHYILADGFHRFHASKDAGREFVACEIRLGDLNDAMDYALAANKSHGLRRTNADKRKAVATALSLERWASRSDRCLAEHVGVSHTFVAQVRGSTGNGCQLV